MTDSAPPVSNLPELSVSELSSNLKRTIESNFDRVRVRGELGRVTIARSGHMYADLKDDRAVINTVMWKGSVNRLPFRPEEGLEVVADGKLSIYAGRSNYQLIAESMRPAGVGALMALLEERKKKLAAEGLFEADKKQALPFLPSVIGVVTSATGAVIRDILHRLRDRFPVRVILWPVLVQGDLAAGQIEAAIKGFNAMPEDGDVPRPDLLIVARGGGSIEDLWPFNEENVVRAAFASQIPLISAVGHETDTTLIDYVSDARAPTPTGAAEIAVPVRHELLGDIEGWNSRLTNALLNLTERRKRDLVAISARFPKAKQLFESRQQRFDYAESRLRGALETLVLRKQSDFARVSGLMGPGLLRSGQRERTQRLDAISSRLERGRETILKSSDERLQRASAALDRRRNALADFEQNTKALEWTSTRLQSAFERRLKDHREALATQSKLLDSLSYEATLQRGYALVRDDQGNIIRTKGTAQKASTLMVQFTDGELPVQSGAGPKPPVRSKSSGPKPDDQQTLL